jgi:hypothetical protein
VANFKKGLARIQWALAWYGTLSLSAGMIYLVIEYDHITHPNPGMLYSAFLALTWGPFLLFSLLSWIIRGFLDVDDD